MIETLENRALLSATFPALVGSYSGTWSNGAGDSGSVYLSVYAQKKGVFFGIVSQSNGMNAVVTGRVTPGGALRFNVKPNVLGQHGKGTGTFSNGTFNATEVIKGRRANVSETITLVRN